MTWNPWRTLRERDHIIFARTRLPDGVDGVQAQRGERSVILIDDRLDQATRRAVLAHELIHEERGGSVDYPGAHACWGQVVVQEERRVDREVARRLIPAADLAEFVAARLSVSDGVTVREVAEHFGVPQQLVILVI